MRFHVAFVCLSLAMGSSLGACDGEISEMGAEPGDPPGLPPGIPPVEIPEDEDLRAPLRRLTRHEYNNIVRDLFGDTSEPASGFPSAESGNGFGNDADALSVSNLLVEQYFEAAEAVAERASADLSRWSDCAESPTDEDECAEAILSSLLPRMYRRPVEDSEIDELLALRTALDAASFQEGMAGLIEAVLQSPDFLYRPEFGQGASSVRDDARTPTGFEMASRLSFLLWSTAPDETLWEAAENGELDTAEGVLRHAERMLDAPEARPVLRRFFDVFFRIGGVAGVTRSEEIYPSFNPTIGALMREETHAFIEDVIFDGAGDYPTLLTAPYTMLNEELAEFYGVSGVSGDEFRRVEIDPSRRLGVLTQGAFLTASTHSNFTSPVRRGGFIVQHILCEEIPAPTGDLAELATPPDPFSAPTARDRYTQHSEDTICAMCHRSMDPIGFGFENFDAIGLWRERENDVLIDARVEVPLLEGELNGPAELVGAISAAEESKTCFARTYMSFALGRDVGTFEDARLEETVNEAFRESGYNIKALILALTQTETFLLLPGELE